MVIKKTDSKVKGIVFPLNYHLRIRVLFPTIWLLDIENESLMTGGFLEIEQSPERVDFVNDPIKISHSNIFQSIKLLNYNDVKHRL